MTEHGDQDRRWLLTVGGGMLEAVGGVAVHFAQLEDEVSQFIWSLLAGWDVCGESPDAEHARETFAAQKRGQAVTRQLSVRQKLDVLTDLAFERFKDAARTVDAIRSLVAEAREPAETRNRVMHAVWAGLSQPDGSAVPGTAVSVKTTRDRQIGMAQSVSVHTQEELAALAESISRLSYRFTKQRVASFVMPPS